MPEEKDWHLNIPFFIDTDGYSDRDREMFVCGFEFCHIIKLIEEFKTETPKPMLVSIPIHRENASRIRMIAGAMKVTVLIKNHTDYEDCETWADLRIIDT